MEYLLHRRPKSVVFFNTDFAIFYSFMIPSDFIVCKGDRRGRDRMVVGFTTTYAISAYPTDVVSSNLDQGEVYNIM